MIIIIKKLISLFLVFLILFSQSLNAAAVKSSSSNASSAAAQSTTRVSGGTAGIFRESKSALIGENALETQNYNDTDINIDFSKHKKITLKRVILEALSSSNTLKAIKEKSLVQARIAYEQASNEYLPTVDFEFSNKKEKKYAILEEAKGKREYDVYDEQKYKLTLNQALYSGGSTNINIKIKRNKYLEAKNKFEISVNQTIQEAIKAYFQLLFSIKKVELASKNMNKLEEILKISQVKYDSGAISVGDLAAIKVGVSGAQTNINKLKSRLADSIDFYIYLLSDDFKNTKPFEKNFNLELSTYEELKDDIIDNNLDLINHRLNINGEKDKLRSFKASLKPKVDLQVKINHIQDQETYVDDEETYTTKLILRYNIFNKGNDKNKIIVTYSAIEELKHRYNEEIKKISWDTSKLYNSIKSLGKSLKSNQDEISSANEMVDVYWEGFQLGEQDLQVLLQGQRQLNKAELSLLKFRQDYLTNVFKVLNQTNKLAKFFDINPYHTSFVDYSTVAKMDTTIDLNTSIADPILDLNETVTSYLDVIHEYGYDDIVNFKDKFLTSNNNWFTILISEFNNNYETYNYIKDNRLFSQSFVYDFLKENGNLKIDDINKRVKIKSNIAYGIYKTKKEAKVALDNMYFVAKKQYLIKDIKDIKEEYSRYVNGLETEVEPYIIKPKPKKVFRTNSDFKNKFMNANKELYTINIVSLSYMKQAQKLLSKYNITKDALVFKYGKRGEWVKVMYGVYNTYEDALNALNKKEDMKDIYHPIIEKISNKQKLYKQYERFNRIIKVKTQKQRAGEFDRKLELYNLKKKAEENKLLEFKKKAEEKRLLEFKKKEEQNKLIELKKQEEQNKLIELKKQEEQISPKSNIKIDIPSSDILNKELNTSILKQDIKIRDLTKESTLIKNSISKKLPKLNLSEKQEEIFEPKPKKEILQKKKKVIKVIKVIKKHTTKSSLNNNLFKDGLFTIHVAYVKPKNLETFINKTIPDNNYQIFKVANFYKILYGSYKTKDQAKKSAKKLFAKRINKTKIININSLKNNELIQKKIKAKKIIKKPKLKIKPISNKESNNTINKINQDDLINDLELKENLQSNILDLTKQNLQIQEDEINVNTDINTEDIIKPINTKPNDKKIKNNTLSNNIMDIQLTDLTKESTLIKNSISKKLPKLNLSKKQKKVFEPKPKKEILQKKKKVIKVIKKHTTKSSLNNNLFKDGLFTIHVAYVKPKNLETFINKTIPDNNYQIFKVANFYKILYGSYKTKDQAKKSAKKLFAKRINKTKIININSLKNNELIQKKIKAKKIIKKPKSKIKDNVFNTISSITYSEKFKNTFLNSSNNSFTILLAKIKKNKINNFISRYILDSSFIIKKEINYYKIMYGIYNSKIDAKNNIENLHPKIIDSVKVISIKSIK